LTASLDGIEQHFDHNAPEHAVGRRARYADLRQSCPVLHSDNYDGFFVLSRHRDIIRVLKNPRTFSSASGITIPRMTLAANSIPTESDEPDHSHYRRVLWPFLTPRAVAGYEGLVRRTVTELINDFIETGQADIMEQLAKPVPALVTGQFFGFTAEEGRRLYELLETMLAIGPTDPERGQAAGTELYAMYQASLDAARHSPGEDVSSAIVTYDYEGRTFSNDECLGLLLTATAGALATTVAAIGCAVRLLWEFPDQRRRLIEHPELSARAVEEVLRMDAPAHALLRTVTESCEVGGVTLESGDRVLLLYDSGNYDGGAFEDPEQFKVDRPNNAHLSFGHGIHKCEGQHLARLEIQVVIEEFLRRIPDYEVVSTPTLTTAGGVLGLANLHITFPPAAGVSV
jgi:cytochrome P450